MVSKVGAKEFRRRAINRIKQIDNSISYDDLYFHQMTTICSVSYKPNYPDKSNADFIIEQDISGFISIYGNFESLIPTRIEYANIEDFEKGIVAER